MPIEHLDSNSKFLLGYKGSSLLDAGFFYAPYIPLMMTPFITQEQIKKNTRIPIKIIKVAMKQAGYKINRDFTIEINGYSNEIRVNTQPGRRFADYGTCQIHCSKGRMNIFWSYPPTPGGKATNDVDIILADPNSFKKISDTIIQAVKECLVNPIKPGIMNRYGKVSINPSLYGKVTL